jgi:hypothetical protein
VAPIATRHAGPHAQYHRCCRDDRHGDDDDEQMDEKVNVPSSAVSQSRQGTGVLIACQMSDGRHGRQEEDRSTAGDRRRDLLEFASHNAITLT